MWRWAGRLTLLARQLIKLEVDVQVIASSGIGILANDSSLWSDTESKVWARKAPEQ